MDEYLTVNQAATLLHVSPTTIRRWIDKGKLKAKKIATGRNGRILIEKMNLERLLLPVPVKQRPRRLSEEERNEVVNRILAFRKKFAGRGIDVDALIDENRRERDRE